MGYKKKVLVTLPFLTIIFLSVFFTCDFNEDLCSQNNYEIQALFILSFSASSLLPLIVLYFLREEVFNSWWRFAKWYLPLPVAFILFPKNQHGHWGVGDPFGASDSQILFLAALFFIISLGIIVIKSWKLRAKKQVG